MLEHLPLLFTTYYFLWFLVVDETLISDTFCDWKYMCDGNHSLIVIDYYFMIYLAFTACG